MENQENDNPKENKRLKIETLIPQSNLFSTFEDEKNYEELFEALQESDLVANAHIPLCIIKEIAHSGTGTIKDCGNPECSDKAVVLQEDYGEDEDHPQHDTYRVAQSYLEERFFCGTCKSHLKLCEDCDEYMCTLYCHRCGLCEALIYNCSIDICNNPKGVYEKCGQCSAIMCEDCSHECDHCARSLCSKCRIVCGKSYWTAADCAQCGDSLVFCNHEDKEPETVLEEYWKEIRKMKPWLRRWISKNGRIIFTHCSCGKLVCVKCHQDEKCTNCA